MLIETRQPATRKAIHNQPLISHIHQEILKANTNLKKKNRHYTHNLTYRESSGRVVIPISIGDDQRMPQEQEGHQLQEEK